MLMMGQCITFEVSIAWVRGPVREKCFGAASLILGRECHSYFMLFFILPGHILLCFLKRVVLTPFSQYGRIRFRIVHSVCSFLSVWFGC